MQLIGKQIISLLVLVDTRKCKICASDFATDMRYKSQVWWKICRSSWTLYCESDWSANCLHRHNQRVRCCWLPVISASVHQAYGVPQENMVSGEAWLWTCVLLKTELWAEENETLDLLRTVGPTTGRSYGVSWDDEDGHIYGTCTFAASSVVSPFPSVPSKLLS